jgi:S1-C subfamily serine protease
LFILAISPRASAQDEVEELVVMIRAQWPEEENIGAGVIAGSSLGRVYIVTAQHVVVSRTGDASGVSVEFNFLPGETFAATVLSPRSSDLDLAVLKIDADEEVLAYIDSWEYDKFRAAGGLLPGDEVHKIGYAEGKPWFRDLRPDFVSQVGGDALEIQSQNVVPGYSGGVFVDGDNRIIGMIRRVQDDVVFVTPVDAVLDQLTKWRFQVPWKIETGSSTTPAPLTRYALTVSNGAGGGQFAEGSVVTIVANPPEPGLEFKGWTAPASVSIEDRTSLVTTLTMPATDVSVAAVFQARVETLRLTPDLGMPRRSGTLSSTSGNVFEPRYMSFGDRGRGETNRAFITFDLSALPEGAEIGRADLIMRYGGKSGDILTDTHTASGFFGTFVVESVNIGRELDLSDYNRAGLSLGEHPTELFQENWTTVQPVDARAAVQNALNVGARFITFRLSFLTSGDNDDQQDVIALDDRGDRLRLEIDYSN